MPLFKKKGKQGWIYGFMARKTLYIFQKFGIISQKQKQKHSQQDFENTITRKIYRS